MRRTRVVLTGVGALAATGVGAPAFWQALLDRRSGIGPVSRVPTDGLPPQIAGEVRGFDPGSMTGGAVRARHLARHTQFALAAALEAFRDAGLQTADLQTDSAPVGVLVGVSMGGFDFIEREIRRIVAHGNASMRPSVIGCIHIAAAATIAEALRLRARLCVFSNSCTGGLDAVAQAARWIEEGRCEVALAGGSDAPIETCLLAGFSAARMLAQPAADPARSSRPFDLDRTGGVLAEGAGVVVLESESHARARGARPYLEICGADQSSDGPGEEDAVGLGAAMRGAMAEAGWIPDDVDWVCAHAPGDPEIDRVEVAQIKRVLGARAAAIPVTSIKGVIGSPLAAAGALQVVAAAQAFRSEQVPPSAHLDRLDPDCDLDHVPEGPRRLRVRGALINSHGIGRINSALAVRRWETP